MEQKKITFDSFVRGFLGVVTIVAIIMLLNRLSGVLLPFFLAWLIAYILFPLVKFFQYRCHLKFRLAGILCTFLVVGLVLTGLFMLMVPPIIEEGARVKELAEIFIANNVNLSNIPDMLEDFIHEHFTMDDLKALITQEGFIDTIKQGLPKIWDMITQSLGIVSSMISMTMVAIYTLFILLDYEAMAEGWVPFLPERYRPFAQKLVKDVEQGMNLYFRGQGLVAFCVGVLFSIGFLIIDFPMAIGLCGESGGYGTELLAHHAGSAHRLRCSTNHPGHHPDTQDHGTRHGTQPCHHPPVTLHLGLTAGHSGHGHRTAHDHAAHHLLPAICS